MTLNGGSLETKNTFTPQKASITAGKVENHPNSSTSKKDGNITHLDLHKPNEFFPEVQTPGKSKTTIDKLNLPEFLPAEYLEDSMEIDEAPIKAEPNTTKYPKKKIFADLVEKKPKDRTKGNTTYRVSEARGIASSVLAPAAAPNALSLKDAWMRGIGRHGIGGNRKVANAGFFVRR
jgi:U3 snoRNA associated